MRLALAACAHHLVALRQQGHQGGQDRAVEAAAAAPCATRAAAAAAGAGGQAVLTGPHLEQVEAVSQVGRGREGSLGEWKDTRRSDAEEAGLRKAAG